MNKKKHTVNLRQARRPAFRAVLLYVGVAALWIIFSDQLVTIIAGSPEAITRLQTAKEIVFVILTAALFFYILWRSMEQQAVANESHLDEIRELYETQSRQAREKRELESRFEELLELLPHGVQENDLEGRITYSNRAHAELHGYQEKQLEGRYIWDFQPDDKGKTELKEYFRYLVEEQPEPTPYLSRNITRDGREIHVQVDWTYKRNLNGELTGFISIITDISEHIHMENHLRSALDHANVLFEHAAIPIWEEDFSDVHAYLQALRQKGVSNFDEYFRSNPAELTKIALMIKILRVNRKSLEFYQVNSREELVTELPVWFIDESWEVFREEIVHIANGQSHYSGEIPVKTVEGEIKYLLIHLSVPPGYQETLERVLVSFIDITERRVAEKAWQEQVLRNEKMLQTTLDGYILADPEGVIKDVNPSYCRMIGYERSELLQKNIREIEATLSPEAVQERIQLMLRDGKARFKTRHRHKKGHFVELDVSVNILPAEEGPLVAAFVRDISEQVKYQQELLDSRQEYRALAGHLQTVREEERRSLAREIHDELGQVLSVIKMDLSLIEDELGKSNRDYDPQLVRSEIDNIYRLIDRSVRQLNQLVTRLRPEIIDTLGLIPALEWQTREVAERAGLQWEFHSDVSRLDLDADASIALFRIVQEALTNIVRHAMATHISVRLRCKPDAVLLEIKDNGAGFSVSESAKSSRFGLLGMRERAAILNADFNVQSELKKGTLISLGIPRKMG